MAAAFVDGDDLLARTDRRDIAELASDTGTPVPDNAIATNANVVVALEDAEGEVVSSLLSGGRYSETDLSALSGTALSFLKRIICEVAALHLYRRRTDFKPEIYEAYLKISEMYFKRLSSGEAVFGGSDLRAGASLASVDGPTLSEIESQNMITDRSGYFRRRVLPDGRNI